MSEKLIIEKFGPIKRLEIDLAKVLILIGPQSSGKSTIAKLVSIFRDFSFVVGSLSFTEALRKYGIDSYLDKNTSIEYKTKEYHFLYEKQNAQIIPIKGEKLALALKSVDAFNPKTPKKVSSMFKKSNLYQKNDQVETMINFITNRFKILDKRLIVLEDQKQKKILDTKELERIKKEMHSFEELINKLENITDYSVYIPAERLFISMIADSIISLFNNSIPLPKVILEFGASFEKARKNISSYEVDFLDISYKRIKNEDRIYLNKRKHIQLSNASSGLQSLIPLLLVIQDNLNDTSKENTYVIEEPELNLYPKAQYELAKIISSICSESTSEYKKNNKIVITTHSPYILTAFNNFLLANKLSDKINQEEIENILSQKIWVSQEDFNAYYIDGKNTAQIFNKKTGLIVDNHLDDASEVIMEDFDNLMDLYSNTLLNGQAN